MRKQTAKLRADEEFKIDPTMQKLLSRIDELEDYREKALALTEKLSRRVGELENENRQLSEDRYNEQTAKQTAYSELFATREVVESLRKQVAEEKDRNFGLSETLRATEKRLELTLRVTDELRQIIDKAMRPYLPEEGIKNAK